MGSVSQVSTYNDLAKLAALIDQRNHIGKLITEIVGRPALTGHVGEYIASRIFQISLLESASNQAYDGFFQDGPLAGKNVNIKWYAQQSGLLDITPSKLPDTYLVMTGPKTPAMSSRGTVQPWQIAAVYCFVAPKLVADLTQARVKVGIATSVRSHFWKAAEVYPEANNPLLILTDVQRELLALFDGVG